MTFAWVQKGVDQRRIKVVSCALVVMLITGVPCFAFLESVPR